MKFIRITLLILSVLFSLNSSREIDDICFLPKKIGRCRAKFPSYYYDYSLNKCIKFYYGGCGGNANRFRSIRECKETCLED